MKKKKKWHEDDPYPTTEQRQGEHLNINVDYKFPVLWSVQSASAAEDETAKILQ